jgi:hypothetical protein
MDLSPDDIISRLDLQPHPEGGYYKEYYRSELEIMPKGFKGARNVSTAIYFMLTENMFSAFHRIKSDEIWHHYLGGTAEIHILEPNGAYRIDRLGSGLELGNDLQVVVPANSWFASRLVPDDGFMLAGCTVAPGFDFRDFQLAERQELIEKFPGYRDIIETLTR